MARFFLGSDIIYPSPCLLKGEPRPMSPPQLSNEPDDLAKLQSILKTNLFSNRRLLQLRVLKLIPFRWIPLSKMAICFHPRTRLLRLHRDKGEPRPMSPPQLSNEPDDLAKLQSMLKTNLFSNRPLLQLRVLKLIPFRWIPLSKMAICFHPRTRLLRLHRDRLVICLHWNRLNVCRNWSKKNCWRHLVNSYYN